ncbi:anthranilate 1,2-dioxygenase small subunit AndAd [Acidisoma cladoniae]|jgi:anthranilate 1,2-dioxygenase small subunit|uniref:anthranilate 1,2-dioxygenase small subunit AndAd n=1 Tax=Acidisoma cladoniae TaxID=3040935 RepID=UPI00254CB073|nr:anthranilate 1,2-dioxygenase small subunit AndAd [Acidisoma sp. PAMC 29798]
MTLPETLMLRLELMALNDLYTSILDNDRLEEWPRLFVDDCLYEIIPSENEDMGLPAPVMLCDNIRMMRDRVVALRHANIYEKVAYRHMVSGLEFTVAEDGTITARSSYIVVNTSLEGFSEVYQAGSYRDVIVRTREGLRYKSRRCVYDTLKVQTLLAVPI